MTRRPRPHQPMRPAWLCRNCAAPWPCAPAQLHLATEFYGHSIALAFYLAANMQDAVDDLYSIGVRPDPRALHARFLGWLSVTADHTAPACADHPREVKCAAASELMSQTNQPPMSSAIQLHRLRLAPSNTLAAPVRCEPHLTGPKQKGPGPETARRHAFPT
jgi:hypothetical protein